MYILHWSRTDDQGGKDSYSSSHWSDRVDRFTASALRLLEAQSSSTNLSSSLLKWIFGLRLEQCLPTAAGDKSLGRLQSVIRAVMSVSLCPPPKQGHNYSFEPVMTRPEKIHDCLLDSTSWWRWDHILGHSTTVRSKNYHRSLRLLQLRFSGNFGTRLSLHCSTSCASVFSRLRAGM
ncbi:unnamed protein product [Pleuronectes platessa]|uniref:Uncharacterized protein n=1 Tax=Pleuronectes platessa TaxID=8262 RepID=A0A9N7UBR2_PLEPL|nr:unnamed protein product [Pleuronectes platessa]